MDYKPFFKMEILLTFKTHSHTCITPKQVKLVQSNYNQIQRQCVSDAACCCHYTQDETLDMKYIYIYIYIPLFRSGLSTEVVVLSFGAVDLCAGTIDANENLPVLLARNELQVIVTHNHVQGRTVVPGVTALTPAAWLNCQ